MVRFYKRIQDQWFYKECWQDGDRVIFHHGVVGNEGKVDSEPCLDFSAYYNSFKRKYEKQGYSEFSPRPCGNHCIEICPQVIRRS